MLDIHNLLQLHGTLNALQTQVRVTQTKHCGVNVQSQNGHILTAVALRPYLDLAEQVLMKQLQQQTEQTKKQQHLPSNQLKMDQQEGDGMAA
jgi:hypothetical protein